MDSPRTRPTRPTTGPQPGYQPVAEIEIDAVTPSDRGFTLTGRGVDRLEYRLDVHFELPLDLSTRRVLGELLSQSDLTISRRGAPTTPASRNS